MMISPTARVEEVPSSGGPMRVIARLILAHPGPTLVSAGVGLVVGALGWCVPYLVQVVLDRSSNLPYLTWMTLGVGLAVVIRGCLAVLRKYLQIALVRKVESELAHRYLGHVLRLDMAEYERLPAAELLNRLQGLEQVRHALEERILGLAFDVVLVAAAAVVMAAYSVPLMLLASLGATLPAIVVFFIKRSLRDSFKETQRLSSRLTDGCLDALEGIRELRAMGGDDGFTKRLESDYSAVQERRARHLLKLSVIGNATGLLSTLLSVIILLVGGYGLHAGRLSPGQLMFLFTMAGSMLGPIENLVISWLFFEDAAGALERYQHVVGLPAEARTGTTPASEMVGEIRLEKVTFAYRPGEPVLRGIDLHIPAGRSVAIVGESGAGKTTLLGLLAGIRSPQEGRITIDGRDYRDWDASSRKRQIGVVFQSPHLFRATLEENLLLSCPTADVGDLRRAMNEACASGFVSSLPNGYSTPISSGGAPFSGGQLQRLAIAMALVRSPKLLLLDEATSNLDHETENAVWSALEGGKGRRTTVFVTHRLGSSARADEILVMDGGQVVERGSFAELLERRGRYYELWRRQRPMGVPDFPSRTEDVQGAVSVGASGASGGTVR